SGETDTADSDGIGAPAGRSTGAAAGSGLFGPGGATSHSRPATTTSSRGPSTVCTNTGRLVAPVTPLTRWYWLRPSAVPSHSEPPVLTSAATLMSRATPASATPLRAPGAWPHRPGR